ncbi:MAG: histidinol dehydrogenase [Woeseia sp.]|nr:histidinol dehydrogenase [Woeseia sp.]|tara:strand:- start:23 stop:1336 length:1314 start_codon:yes stop_codon:yes gene_type:complete
MNIEITNWDDLSSRERNNILKRPIIVSKTEIKRKVRKIIETVRTNGDLALRELTKQYDKAEINSFRVSPKELAKAKLQINTEQLEAIKLAIANIKAFHAEQLPQPVDLETMPGVRTQRITHPIDAVGLYVPAGNAPLPSTAIMLSVPAKIAGCPTKIMCTPPRRDGTADPAVITAASIAGVNDIYKIGGAQAIAAMAYGTETIPKVNKVFGPGNSWVTEAKTQVSNDSDGAAIDMPAGPSEVLVIADEDASPPFIASDLLSQAEHGIDSQVVLISTCPDLASQVVKEIQQRLRKLSRNKIASQSIKGSLILITEDLESAITISNRYAPEHLILHVTSPRKLLPDIRNAGSIFLGKWSPESVGDYCSGTNHVLPTDGHARNQDGLSVEQFTRYMTVQELTSEGLELIGNAVITLANLEGLDAHAEAVKCRLKAIEDRK